MHEWDWAYPFFHSAHHESKTVTPATAMAIPPIGMNLTFSISPILLTPFIPISILGFFIVNFLLQFQIILCHYGYELVPERVRSFPLLRHIYFYTEHIEHHREERSLYGTFFKIWDRWHRTESTKLMQKRA
jgi:sterol desaturase/sphingolipid hydroxylase (fatty acid hydroxylase superfamily)